MIGSDYMLKRIMKREDSVEDLSERTGFFKKDVKEMVIAYENLIYELFDLAEFGADSEVHIAPGIVISGERVHKKKAKDPRTNADIISPEKVIPHASFKQSLRYKLRKQ